MIRPLETLVITLKAVNSDCNLKLKNPALLQA